MKFRDDRHSGGGEGIAAVQCALPVFLDGGIDTGPSCHAERLGRSPAPCYDHIAAVEVLEQRPELFIDPDPLHS